MKKDVNYKWISSRDKCFAVNGLYWFEENQLSFQRLPKRVEEKVPRGVWDVAQCPSGGRIRFKTDSTSLNLRICHKTGPICYPHMCAVGTAGIDIYEGAPVKMVFWNSNRPGDPENPYISTYFEALPRQMREFTLYLPTYANLDSLDIGLDSEAAIERVSDFKFDKPIAFYGTSITQGGCASRSSTGYVPLLCRMLGSDFINLGFSGAGKCEIELAMLLAEIEASVYVIDPVANLTVNLAEERYVQFIEKVRELRPDTPILLMTRLAPTHYNYLFNNEDNVRLQRFIQSSYEKLVKNGDKNLYFYDMFSVFNIAGEHPTVDGAHPTDLGFKMMADALFEVLGKLIA